MRPDVVAVLVILLMGVVAFAFVWVITEPDRTPRKSAQLELDVGSDSAATRRTV